MNARLLIGLVLHLLTGTIAAQEAEHLFAGRALALIDPSRTGYGRGVQLAQVHQVHQPHVSERWKSDALLVEWNLRNPHKVSPSWLGLGAMVLRDAFPGTANGTTSTGLMASGHLRTGARSYLSCGLGAQWVVRRSGVPDGAWGSQYDGGRYDPSMPSGEMTGTSTGSVLEARGGLSWALKRDRESALRSERDLLVAGLAMDHIGHLVINEQGAPLQPVPLRVNAYVQGELPLAGPENYYLSGEIVGTAQGPFNSIRLNGYFGKHLLNVQRKEGGPVPVGYRAGLGYGYQGGLLCSATLDLQRLSFGSAFGLPIGRAATSTSSTFEFLLQLRFAR